MKSTCICEVTSRRKENFSKKSLIKRNAELKKGLEGIDGLACAKEGGKNIA